MSAPSDNMPIPAPAIRSKPLVVRHLPYFIGAAILVALAANMRFDGYVHNILLQATTFSIAVFGLSVVLGLCGQINLAQAAFFGLGAYAVGIGTNDLHVSFWLCLVGGCVISLLAGAFLAVFAAAPVADEAPTAYAADEYAMDEDAFPEDHFEHEAPEAPADEDD